MSVLLFIIAFILCCGSIFSAFLGYHNWLKAIYIKGILQCIISVLLLALVIVAVMNMNL